MKKSHILHAACFHVGAPGIIIVSNNQHPALASRQQRRQARHEPRIHLIGCRA